MRRRFSSLLFLAAFVTTTLPASAQSAAPSPTTVTIQAFPLPELRSGPTWITAGPDGAMWFTEYDARTIGRIEQDGTLTEYPLPWGDSWWEGPVGIVAGPDGALWFTAGGSIGRVTTAGVMTRFKLPASRESQLITSGPDGAMWFTEYGYGTRVRKNWIGRITPDGQLNHFRIRSPENIPNDITVGSDGNLWFTQESGRIGQITPTGTITQFRKPNGGFPLGITSGPDGALWFTEYEGNAIGRLTTEGAFTRYPLRAFRAHPIGITSGPDGALWFVQAHGEVGRITTDGVVTQWPSGPDRSRPVSIALSPSGDLWFTDQRGNSVSRITLS